MASSDQGSTGDSYFAVLDGRGVGQIRFGVRDGESRIVCHCSSHHEMQSFFDLIRAGRSEAEVISEAIQEANRIAPTQPPLTLKGLYRMSKADLRALVREHDRKVGRNRLVGGPEDWSQDELISHIVRETDLLPESEIPTAILAERQASA